VIVKRNAVVPKHHKVGLFHHWGGGNLGDDATSLVKTIGLLDHVGAVILGMMQPKRR
jgi:hypothetical protein